MAACLNNYIKEVTLALYNQDIERAEKLKIEYIPEDEGLKLEVEYMIEHLMKLVTDLTTEIQDVHIYTFPTE